MPMPGVHKPVQRTALGAAAEPARVRPMKDMRGIMIIANKKNTFSGSYDGFKTHLLIGESNVGTKRLSIQITDVEVNKEQFLHSHEPEQCDYIVKGRRDADR